MLQGVLEYLKSMYTDTVVFRTAVLSFACAMVLTPPQKKKPWLFFVEVLSLTAVFNIVALIYEGIGTALSATFAVRLMCEHIRDIIIYVLYALFICRYPLKNKLIMTSTILAASVEMVNFSYITGRLIDATVSGLTIPMLVLVYAFIAVLAVFESRFSMAKFDDFPTGGLVLILIINTIGVAATFVTMLLDTALGLASVYSSMVYMLLYILTVVSYFSFYIIYLERDRRIRLEAKNRMAEATSEQFRLTVRNMEDLRKIRHDMKNNYSYMRALLEKKEYAKLDDILSSFSSKKLKPEFYIDCGNDDMSAILTMEAAKAYDEGIHLDCEIVCPKILPFDNVDLCSIIANLIDNAIDSNIKGNIKEIGVKIVPRNSYLYICVKNKLPEGADTERLRALKTTKTDDAEHGIGTKIVQELAEKYGGCAVFDIQNDEFIVEVLLDTDFRGGERV